MINERNRERGEGRMGAVISLLILVSLIYLGFKYIPVMVNTYSFRDYMEEEARYAAIRKGDEDIRNRLYERARELTLPVEKSNIQVQRSRHEVTISVKYMVPIETPVFTHRWQFIERATAPLF